jgi:DnaJ family protein C protein 13
LKILKSFPKTSTIFFNDFFLSLGLPQGDHDESKIRKAYFKMAQNYHPDKNPNGRDMFEKVNSAYEFLCNKTNKCNDAVR